MYLRQLFKLKQASPCGSTSPRSTNIYDKHDAFKGESQQNDELLLPARYLLSGMDRYYCLQIRMSPLIPDTLPYP